MVDKVLTFVFKIDSWKIWLVAAVIIGWIAQTLIGNLLYSILVYLPFILFQEGVSRSERFVAWLIAKRNSIVLVTIATTSLIGLVLFFVISNLEQTSTVTQSNLRFDKDLLRGIFCFLGIIFGSLFRFSVGRMIYRALLERRRLGFEILALIIWATMAVILLAVIWYYPWHRPGIPPYICGIAIGILIHKGTKWWFEKQAETRRRIENVVGAWRLEPDPTPLEKDMIELLAKGRNFPSMKYKNLRREIERWRDTKYFSKRIALISASVFRIEGDYEPSVDEAAITSGKVNEFVDCHLLLMKSINLADLNPDNDIESERALELVLNSSKCSTCPLAKATKALRLAEKVLEKPGDLPSTRLQPLKLAQEALDLRRTLIAGRKKQQRNIKTKTDLEQGEKEDNADSLSRFLDLSIPVTYTFMLDVLGYSYLAAGFSHEARVLIERCIETDPTYSSAYLHLGDYFLFRNLYFGTMEVLRRNDLWHANLCYRIAIYIEKKRKSKIRRLAEGRIELLPNLQTQLSDVNKGSES